MQFLSSDSPGSDCIDTHQLMDIVALILIDLQGPPGSFRKAHFSVPVDPLFEGVKTHGNNEVFSWGTGGIDLPSRLTRASEATYGDDLFDRMTSTLQNGLSCNYQSSFQLELSSISIFRHIRPRHQFPRGFMFVLPNSTFSSFCRLKSACHFQAKMKMRKRG